LDCALGSGVQSSITVASDRGCHAKLAKLAHARTEMGRSRFGGANGRDTDCDQGSDKSARGGWGGRTQARAPRGCVGVCLFVGAAAAAVGFSLGGRKT